ncbi:glycosyltransferase, partial [bacterium]|nr:glycosyltransferase [bacterium]
MNQKINKTPLVTIITITFNIINNNRSEQLEQCIKSVRQQTYQNIEHLIIDGGSKDGTIKILKKFQKKEWIRFISEPDKGKYDAMNKGIKLSKGSYITFLNSDDFYHNQNGIKTSISSLIKNKADFSYAPVTDYDEKKQKKHILTPNIKTVFFKITPNHQTIIYKKSIITKEKGYDAQYQCLADYDLTIRLCLKNYKSIFNKNNYVTYRLGGYSLEATKNGTVYQEEATIYYNNYNKLCKISKKQCEKIIGKMYHGTIKNIPLE